MTFYSKTIPIGAKCIHDIVHNVVFVHTASEPLQIEATPECEINPRMTHLFLDKAARERVLVNLHKLAESRVGMA